MHWEFGPVQFLESVLVPTMTVAGVDFSRRVPDSDVPTCVHPLELPPQVFDGPSPPVIVPPTNVWTGPSVVALFHIGMPAALPRALQALPDLVHVCGCPFHDWCARFQG